MGFQQGIKKNYVSNKREYTISFSFESLDYITSSIAALKKKLVGNDTKGLDRFIYYRKNFDVEKGEVVLLLSVQAAPEILIDIENSLSDISEKAHKRHVDTAVEKHINVSNRERDVAKKKYGSQHHANKTARISSLEGQQRWIDFIFSKEAISLLFNPLLWIFVIVITACVARFIFGIVPSGSQ